MVRKGLLSAGYQQEQPGLYSCGIQPDGSTLVQNDLPGASIDQHPDYFLHQNSKPEKCRSEIGEKPKGPVVIQVEGKANIKTLNAVAQTIRALGVADMSIAAEKD